MHARPCEHPRRCIAGLSGNVKNDPIEGLDEALMERLYTDSR